VKSKFDLDIWDKFRQFRDDVPRNWTLDWRGITRDTRKIMLVDLPQANTRLKEIDSFLEVSEAVTVAEERFFFSGMTEPLVDGRLDGHHMPHSQILFAERSAIRARTHMRKLLFRLASDKLKEEPPPCSFSIMMEAAFEMPSALDLDRFLDYAEVAIEDASAGKLGFEIHKMRDASYVILEPGDNNKEDDEKDLRDAIGIVDDDLLIEFPVGSKIGRDTSMKDLYTRLSKEKLCRFLVGRKGPMIRPPGIAKFMATWQTMQARMIRFKQGFRPYDTVPEYANALAFLISRYAEEMNISEEAVRDFVECRKENEQSFRVLEMKRREKQKKDYPNQAHSELPLTLELPQRDWCSRAALMNNGKEGESELCNIINHFLRDGNPSEMDAAAKFCASLQTSCDAGQRRQVFTVGREHPRLEGQRRSYYRGVGLPQQALDQFKPGLRYRTPMLVAFGSSRRELDKFGDGGAGQEMDSVFGSKVPMDYGVSSQKRGGDLLKCVMFQLEECSDMIRDGDVTWINHGPDDRDFWELVFPPFSSFEVVQKVPGQREAETRNKVGNQMVKGVAVFPTQEILLRYIPPGPNADLPLLFWH